MAREPETSEEYIQRVQEQAEAQSKEHIPSHVESWRKVSAEREYYRQQLKFYFLVLVVLVISYVCVQLLPALTNSPASPDFPWSRTYIVLFASSMLVPS